MADILHQQWREQHKASQYPFADRVGLVSLTGLEFGNDTLLDATLYPIGGDARLYLTSVVVVGSQITFNCGTPVTKELCSVTFDALAPPAMLRLTDTYERSAGVMVTDPLQLARFQSWSPGTHPFDQSASEFAASVCVPTPEIGVRGLLTEAGDLLTGDLWIVGTDGVVVREDPVDAPAGVRVIRVDIVGDPLFRRRLCQGTAENPGGPLPLFGTLDYLRTINGLPPDEFGDFKITAGGNDAADTILRIYNTPNGVVFEAVGQPG